MEKRTPGTDVFSSIFDILRDHAAQQDSELIGYAQAEGMVLMRGFTTAQLRACLGEYQLLNVLEMDENWTTIRILGSL